MKTEKKGLLYLAEVFSGGFRLYEHTKMDVWFMVFKRSVFKMQKQHTKNFKDPSYGYGAIHENVPKLRLFAQLRNFVTLVCS